MPKTAANSSDQPGLDRVDKVEEEELDVQYQAAIQSLLNRATELSGEAAEACVPNGADTVSASSPAPPAEIVSGATESVSEAAENAQTPADPTDVEPEDTSLMRSMPTPRSRPSETTDQLRDLRRIAQASAHTAITTHAALRRKQILLPIYVAIPLGLFALIVSPWVFPGGATLTLAMLGICLAVIIVAARGFLALRELQPQSSSSEEPADPASDA